jgi:hypothetical protein
LGDHSLTYSEKSGDKVKTDKHDAEQWVRLFRAGELTPRMHLIVRMKLFGIYTEHVRMSCWCRSQHGNDLNPFYRVTIFVVRERPGVDWLLSTQNYRF